MKFHLIAILFMTISCSALDTQRIAPNYLNAFNSIKGYFLGYENSTLTRELIDKIPYASLKLQIGKGTPGLLILEEENDGGMIYVSADGVRFVIKEGVILRTSGLENNLLDKLEPSNSMDSFLESGKESDEYLTYHSYDEPRLINLKLKTTIRRGEIEKHVILGKSYDLIRIEQTIENSYLGWKETNIFWLNPNSYFVWKSKQYISPLLPAVYYEVTKKPAD